MFNFLKRKKNIDEIAINFTAKAVIVSYDCAKEVIYDNNIEDSFEFITLEFLWLYLQITDRFAFALSKNREQFINCILDNVPYMVIKEIHGESGINRFNTDFEYRKTYLFILTKHYNDRIQEYSRYKEFAPTKNQLEDGTLLWEFSKIIVNKVLKTDSYLDKLKIIDIAVNGWKKLDILKTVETIKN